MPEYVYILTNPRMPDLIKIGKTKNIKARLNQLSKHSGVPVAFQCYCCYKVDKKEKIEEFLHKIFGDNRINPKREFFEISPANAQTILEKLAIEEVFIENDSFGTKEEQEALKKEVNKNSKLSPFDFLEVGISKGSKLTFRDNEKITAKVIGNKKIMFDGKETSLSPAAAKAFAKMGKSKGPLQGSRYWKYKGKLLIDIREVKIQKEKSRIKKVSRKYSKDSFFDFSKVGIRKGSELTFRDNEKITAKVIGKTEIMLDGEKILLSPAATKAFAKIGKTKEGLQGSRYWKYKGQLLFKMLQA